VLGAAYPNLNLFKQSPGQGVGSGSLPPSVLGDYMGITPARLYDSRTADRLLPLGAGTTGQARVVGFGGVPASGVTAVALNVTAAGAIGPSSFTVWPAGDTKPDVANVTVAAARAVGSLVIVKTGADGRVNITNDLGSAHCIVDVVGYFRTTAANRLQSITPFRALDTRDGTGGRLGAIGAAGTIDVTVRGLGGVPTTADSVVVNVTAVAPTAAGYLTVWPSLQARPLASSLNFAAGIAVPNMVIAKVGTNGKISVFNSTGATHVVIDVLGYMSSSAPGRHFPLPAANVLDTRPSNVAPIGPASTTLVSVLGVAGVPATGVSAVALNIAAHAPTANSFICAWPNGVPRPLAANLNPRAGVDVSNLAIVKVGTAGKVALYNNAGTLDLVVDVVGYFTA
jgi:hypothetical protein